MNRTFTLCFSLYPIALPFGYVLIYTFYHYAVPDANSNLAWKYLGSCENGQAISLPSNWSELYIEFMPFKNAQGKTVFATDLQRKTIETFTAATGNVGVYLNYVSGNCVVIANITATKVSISESTWNGSTNTEYVMVVYYK